MSVDVEAQKQEMLRRIDEGYARFTAMIDALSDEEFSGPTDAAGWTVKDHVAHIAVWEHSILGVIEGKSSWDALGVTEADWRTVKETYDIINESIRQQHLHKSRAEVRSELERTHRTVVETITPMSVEALSQPLSHYQATSRSSTPLYAYIQGDTFGHYEEHYGWIMAIVGRQ